MPSKRFTSSGDPALKSTQRLVLRRLVAVMVAQGRGCEVPDCRYPGIPIDLDATTGPYRYALDEIIPRYLGGSPIDPDNVRPAHHSCNSAAGARVTNQLRRARTQASVTARRW